MLFSLCWRQLIHINHASINITTSILGGRRWCGIWRIRWSPNGYWRSLQLMCCVLWRARWMLMNWGHLSWINDWIIKWRRHRYNRWWQLIFPSSTFVATNNTLLTWHDECNMSLWWFYVSVILFVGGHQKMIANFLAQQLQSCLSFSTMNKLITFFCLNIILIRL